jgi:hypothetical protein
MMLLAMCWLQLPIKTQELANGTYWDLSCLVGSLGKSSSRRLAMMLLAMCWLQLPIKTQ